MHDSLARWIRDIAPMPVACGEVLALTQDGDVPLSRIAAIIEADVRMSLQVLRVANSPIFARRYPALTARDAVVTIGADETARIAIGCALLQDLGTGSTDLPGDALLGHGLLVARSWKAWGYAEATTGVLLNGPLLVVSRDVEAFHQYVQTLEATADYEELHALERQLWGTTRCELADQLAGAWRLPAQIADVLQGWHVCRGEIPGLYEAFSSATQGVGHPLLRAFATR